MLLLIDAGNTRIKWALSDADAVPGTWIRHGSLAHAELAQLAPWHNEAVQQVIHKVIISNVAGQTTRDQLATRVSTIKSVEWFAGQARVAGIVNRYRNPTGLGSDRFASAIGAHALFPNQNLVVATCGTATTIDAVSANGDFVGGMIAPGLQLMAKSLAMNTAQLPQLSQMPDTPDKASLTAHFADHTEAAIMSGCIAAQVGAIEFAMREFSGGGALPLCVLSGGAARYLVPSLRIPYELVDNLVLIGLQVYSQC